MALSRTPNSAITAPPTMITAPRTFAFTLTMTLRYSAIPSATTAGMSTACTGPVMNIETKPGARPRMRAMNV